ncbi:hypothetical protein ACWDG1_34915 [Streptomyces sp. NPDC001177]
MVTRSQSPTVGQSAPPFSSWVRVASGMILLARQASLGEKVVDPGAVELEHLQVEQGVGRHHGGVDLLGAGAGVVRLVREEQIDACGADSRRGFGLGHDEGSLQR